MRGRRSRAASRNPRPGAGRSAAWLEVEDGPVASPSSKLWLCGNVRRRGQRARLDLPLDLVQLGLELGRDVEGVDRVAGAVVGDAERQRSARELAVDHVLDGRVGRDVDLLQRAGDDRLVSVLLVSVDADAVDAGLTGLLQHAQAASSGDLELDVGLAVDLRLGDRLAFGRV